MKLATNHDETSLPLLLLLQYLISELRPNPPGADPTAEQVELSGPSGGNLLGSLVFIESDSPSGFDGPGDINNFFPFNCTFDVKGLCLVDIQNPENPSFTLALVSNLFVDSALDIDPNNDGTIGPDVDIDAEFGTVYDAIGVPDTPSDEAFLYGAQLGGEDFKYITGGEPPLIFRMKSVGKWFAVGGSSDNQIRDINNTEVDKTLFDKDPLVPTFGDINPTIKKKQPPCNPSGTFVQEKVVSFCLLYCTLTFYHFQRMYCSLPGVLLLLRRTYRIWLPM